MSPFFDSATANILAWSFHLFGVWIRVQLWFWIVALVLAGERDPRDVLIWVAVCLVSLLIHEFGHVLAYRWSGIDSHVVIQAWGGVTRPARDVYGMRQQVLVAMAGPAAGFLALGGVIAVGAWLGLALKTGWNVFLPVLFFVPESPKDSAAFHALTAMNDLLYVNLYWGLVNLLPIYPLDGGQAARALFQERQPYDGLKRSLIVSAVTGGAAALACVAMQNLYAVAFFGLLAGLSAMEAERTSGKRRPGGGWR